jgi:hypothetical protein
MAAWSALGVGLARPARVEAATPPRQLLRPTGPEARDLAYVENAARVDATRFPAWRPGQTCANCGLYEFGTGRQRGCGLLPGRLVLSTGWCRQWKARRGSLP